MSASVQSVERAFRILEAVSERPAGVTALAERLGLPKSTTARLLSSLEQLGAVERADGRRWRIGPRVAALAEPTSPARSFAALARPQLAALVQGLGEDAGLSLPDGYEVLYVEQVECDHPVQVRDWTGTRAPLHTVPSGLVFLAEWPESALDAYLARGLVALTARTVTDPDALRARLEEVRRAGYAWGREEYAEGITSVAAPVRDARGHPVAAVHVHGPTYRFPREGEEKRVAAEVAAVAQSITRALQRETR
ncbi:MAG: IclR family transcriptional regulator [Gaiellaceae bacterium]|jgi:IclR family acetate operon transcriptional repressor|nr:MAG: IclR family transcriptional regulator [Gaiellaceae bacterium]